LKKFAANQASTCFVTIESTYTETKPENKKEKLRKINYSCVWFET
jgi:hypothetical protein